MADDSRLTRRQFAAQAAAMGAGLAFGTAAGASPPRRITERRELYPQGVASGDPAPDSVILWTRREPDAGATAHRLTVQVAADPNFRRVVAHGAVTVDARTDWTCRFLAAGLRPRQTYWYRFVDEAGNASRTGRTLTAPAETDAAPVKFAFVSCQDVTIGACNAYRRMLFEDRARPTAEKLSFVLHLGDFIYELLNYPEDVPGGVARGRRLREVVRYPHGERVQGFHVPTDLNDYRLAYKGYLRDPDLQDARAEWPFVPVWDNHEFSWQGYQSQQVFGGEVRPAQRVKVAASQAWYEYQPARVSKPGAGDPFEAPAVEDQPLGELDARGVSHEPNNITAITALRIQRAFRFGRNVEMILTDNRSFMAPGADGGPFSPRTMPFMTDEVGNTILDEGRDYNGGHPPATIRFNGQDVPNTQADKPPQAYLGLEQMAWLKDRLRASRAPWKIWGHSFGTLTIRSDPQNLPAPLRERWPSDNYGVINGGYFVEHRELFDMLKAEGVTGLTIVAGDKHSFWAGYPSKTLPPEPFEPVAVEFITGSISAQGLHEVTELSMPANHPLRALYLHDRPGGGTQCAMNTTVLHGVRASLELARTGDPAAARRLSNPDLSPHLTFADYGGHGYATVRAAPDELETEFVCIGRPLERSPTPDGGPLRYRAVNRVSRWSAGERPRLRTSVTEGDAELAV